MGNTGLLRCEAEMTLLHPHLGEMRHQELRNSPFWNSSLFQSQLVKEGEDFLLKKAPLKTLRVLHPIKISPFVAPTTRKEAPTGNALMGAIPHKAVTNYFLQEGGNRIQGPSKRPSSGRLYPVSSVKEHNRKGGKCKISWVLQSPVSSPQASPKVEASNRLKQAQHFSTCRKVQNGNSRVHQDLPDSRGMGIVNRPIGCLPSHPHPPNSRKYLRFCHRCSSSPPFLSD